MPASWLLDRGDLYQEYGESEVKMLEKKEFSFELKELNEDGSFEDYAAVFDKPDQMNEIIEKGVFKKMLR